VTSTDSRINCFVFIVAFNAGLWPVVMKRTRFPIKHRLVCSSRFGTREYTEVFIISWAGKNGWFQNISKWLTLWSCLWP